MELAYDGVVGHVPQSRNQERIEAENGLYVAHGFNELVVLHSSRNVLPSTI